jgi:hypothetical protein
MDNETRELPFRREGRLLCRAVCVPLRIMRLRLSYHGISCRWTLDDAHGKTTGTNLIQDKRETKSRHRRSASHRCVFVNDANSSVLQMVQAGEYAEKEIHSPSTCPRFITVALIEQVHPTRRRTLNAQSV